MPTVTRIKATLDANTSAPINEFRKKRVAAYARVSTDQDEQFTSFESQIQYYENLIKSNPDYEFVKVYSDEGLSGTSVKKRKGFNQMINDAKDGKIDLILVKSISRFGRNTLDLISYIQTLKGYGVEVHFDKEGIKTFDKNIDMSLAIMSAVAQEESHSISGNVTAGIRYKYARGEYSMCYGSFLGYKKGANGKPEIVKEEAEIVRDIFRWFLRDKLSTYQIAERLNKMGIRTKRNGKWGHTRIKAILKNEKYKGDALLQKGYVKNYLDHVVVKNNGELDQYYVEKGHEPIISDEDWAMAQIELKNREALSHQYSSTEDIFSGTIRCGDCGSFYGRKLWHSTDKYKRFIYQCNHKFSKGKEKCQTPNLTEEQIKKAFVKVFNELLKTKDDVIAISEETIKEVFDTSNLELKKKELTEELADQKALIDNLVKSNNEHPMEQEAFLRKYTRYTEKFTQIKKEIEDTRKEIELKYGNSLMAKRNFEELKKTDEISEFSDIIFTTFVKEVVVHRNISLEFHFITNVTLYTKID